MAHNARFALDGWAGFINGYQIPQEYFRTMDTAQSKAINELGGTWNPSAPIMIGGSGLRMAGVLQISSGATCTTPNGSGKRITHGANDYLGLVTGHAGATRVLMTSCSRFVDISGYMARIAYDNSTEGAASTFDTANSFPWGARMLFPLAVHNGGTFSQAVFTFIVGDAHAGGVPTFLPQFRIYKVDAFGTVTPLKSGTVSGYVTFTPTPGSGAAWFAAGAPQTFTYTLDGGVVIDTSRFNYMAEIVDERGANAKQGNKWTGIACTFTSISDMRPQ